MLCYTGEEGSHLGGFGEKENNFLSLYPTEERLLNKLVHVGDDLLTLPGCTSRPDPSG